MISVNSVSLKTVLCRSNIRRQWLTYSVIGSLKTSQNITSKSTKSAERQRHKIPTIGSRKILSPSEKRETDWIGPPDRDSNLRPIKFHIPPDESPLEREYRMRREIVMKWNQEYWAKHNRKFIKEKNEFVTKKIIEVGAKNPDGSNRQLTAEELSEFYRKFLNENYESHKNYNKEWYKKNIALLWPALKLAMVRTFNSRRR